MPGGRPRKLITAEAKKRAHQLAAHQSYHRKRNPTNIRPDFIAYEPTPPGNVPLETPEDIGLRISQDICIPRDPNEETRENIQTEPVLPYYPHLVDATEDAELAMQLEQIEAQQAECDYEEAEYEALIISHLQKTAITEAVSNAT
jgi:hypothetical protein